MKTYIIAEDPYMDDRGGMHQFKGSFRELLYHVNGVEEHDLDSFMPFKEVPYSYDGPEDDSRYFKKWRDFTDEELIRVFDSGNGDGQTYKMVWCVEEEKTVLGGPN